MIYMIYIYEMYHMIYDIYVIYDIRDIFVYISIYTCLYEQIYYPYINLTTKHLKLCYISTFTKSIKDL